MENIINQHPDVRIELDYFKRMNEHYTLQAGNSSNLVKNQHHWLWTIRKTVFSKNL
jgi:hypothetical protein